MYKANNPAFDMHSEFSCKREPLPTIGSIMVTLLGIIGGALALIWVGVTH